MNAQPPPAPPTPGQRAAMLAAYITAVATIRAAILGQLHKLWLGLGSYRDPNVEQFAKQASIIVDAGQRQIGGLTSAYLSSAAGVPPRAVPDLSRLRGVDPVDVYQRPGHVVWTQLGQGKPIDTAVKTADARLDAIASTDLQLAKTHTARAVLESTPHIVGYRRVLAGEHDCPLCIVASTQRYHTAALMPLHPHCDCAVEPIIGTEDPGQVIDSQRIEQDHQQIATALGIDTTDAADLRRRVEVHEHGEMGPVLSVRTDHWTGPAEAADWPATTT